MVQTKVYGREIKRFGNAFHVMLPTSLVRDSDALKTEQRYNVVFVPVDKDGSMSLSSPDLEGSYARFKKVIG